MTGARPVALPVAALLLNAFVWGLSWWPFRALDGIGLHSLWATVIVYVVGLAALSLWRPGAFIRFARRRGLWWLALAAGLTNAAFNWGVIAGEVVRVVLLFYLMPIWALPLGAWLLDERIEPRAVARVLAAIAGAAVVLWEPSIGLPLPNSLGDWLGLAGGACFALTNVLLRREADSPSEARAMAMFGGGLVVPGVLALGLATAGLIAWPPALAPGWIGGAAVFGGAFVAANLALQYGAARLPAQLTALVMLSEIVFAALSAVWVGGETLSARTLFGAALIFVAALDGARGAK